MRPSIRSTLVTALLALVLLASVAGVAFADSTAAGPTSYLDARAARATPVAVGFLAFALGLPLLLTIAIEVPVAAALGLRRRREMWAVALVSVVTNPPLNLAVIFGSALLELGIRSSVRERLYALGLPPLPLGMIGLLLAEAVIVLVEWVLLVWALGGSKRNLLVTSVIMNAASFAAGIALTPVLAAAMSYFQNLYSHG